MKSTIKIIKNEEKGGVNENVIFIITCKEEQLKCKSTWNEKLRNNIIEHFYIVVTGMFQNYGEII